MEEAVVGDEIDSVINTPHRRRKVEERGTDRRSGERGRERNDVINTEKSSTTTNNNHQRVQDGGGCRLGLRGWRRRCLYALLLFLTATVTLNLALTLFFMRVLDFSTTGLGALQIVKGGLVATSPVHMMDTLVATHLSSRRHLPLTLLAADNVTIAALDENSNVRSSMMLGADKLSCITDALVVRDPRGHLLFSASRDEVVVGARRLVVAGEGGAAFSGSVQTSHVSAPVGKSLLLESTTRALEVAAPQGVTVESRAGGISAHCLGDLTLQSTGGVIKLATSKVVVRGLPTSTVQNFDPDLVGPDVYQVCVCSGGRIFLASPGGVCAADHNFCK
ncbi:zeta-sarcoglycan [Hyalella azteca]|uniref:Zeta-sarcoglycan n=1 Tax=Hyalella azteca TaxID=294128 RepID=A0A8B7N1K8_HYAAZ|nr:zeta-sarcoglycan [Hyalella azteca]